MKNKLINKVYVVILLSAWSGTWWDAGFKALIKADYIDAILSLVILAWIVMVIIRRYKEITTMINELEERKNEVL
jgi:exosortase/archaeosortase